MQFFLKIFLLVFVLFTAGSSAAQDGWTEWKRAYERAALFLYEGRINESAQAFEQAYALALKHFGAGHQYTAVTARYLAEVYRAQGRNDEASSIENQKKQAEQAALNSNNPNDIGALNALAYERIGQNRYEDAVPILRKVLELSRGLYDGRSPAQLTALRDLANAYQRLNRHDDAEPVLDEALSLEKVVYGQLHPEVLGIRASLIYVLAASKRPERAAVLLQEMQPDILAWLNEEIYDVNDSYYGRRVAQLDYVLDIALTLATQNPNNRRIQDVATDILIQSKGIMAEEEAFVAQLIRQDNDASTREAALTVREIRQRLSNRFNQTPSDHDSIGKLLLELDTAERRLGQLSQGYQNQLQVANATSRDLQQRIPERAILVDFRRYDHKNFQRPHSSDHGDPRWVALVMDGRGRAEIVDLGVLDGIELSVDQVVNETRGADEAAADLFQKFIANLAIPPDVETLYISPDSKLYLLPFHRLINVDGKYLAQDYSLRIIQTTRDLLRTSIDQPTSGLLALGGIDFDVPGTRSASQRQSSFEGPQVQMAELHRLAGTSFRDGFSALKNTGPEVARIAELYSQARPNEPTEVWNGDKASETRLKNISQAPRTLHLATHGFYGAADFQERPMVLAGVTLAGANLALGRGDDDGILYAIEAQDLNLEGTELVVLSACETAQGTIAYGEGVFGMARALRTAGARNVLVTSRYISDESAPEFMERFYQNWLSQEPNLSDPAAALRATQEYYIANDPDFDWAPYMLIGTSTAQSRGPIGLATRSPAAAEIPSNSVERALELNKADWVDIQVALALMEIDPGIIDGIATEGTRGAIQRWQEKNGLAATGFLTADQQSQLLQMGEQVALQMR